MTRCIHAIFHTEEGGTFGEIALINPDCIRTASVVADVETDLVVVDREVYNRNLSKVRRERYNICVLWTTCKNDTLCTMVYL